MSHGVVNIKLGGLNHPERGKKSKKYWVGVKLIPSEARSLVGLESRFVWLLGAYVLRASKFSLLLSSATQATSPSVLKS